MIHELYWSHMANNVYTTIGDCRECVMSRAGRKRKCYLKRFPASCPCNSLQRTLGPASKNNKWEPVHPLHGKLVCETNSGSPVIQNQCPTFCVDRFRPMGATIRNYLLLITDNRPKFVSKVLETSCTVLLVKHISITSTTHKQTARPNTITKPLSCVCVIMLPKPNTTGADL